MSASALRLNLPPQRRFQVQAVAEPSVLSRVIEQFALRNLVPCQVDCRLDRSCEPSLAIDVRVRGLSDQEAAHVARRLGQFPMVLGVRLSPPVD